MLATLLQTMRLPFLILTPVCILLGVATAETPTALFSFNILLVFIAGLLAHISVNMLNEYQDFRSGLDLVTKRTPFSGGSGGLPANPSNAFGVLIGALVSLTGVVVIGFVLAFKYPQLWMLGLVGGLIIVTYTRQINRIPWLCLIAPGIGFGFIMVCAAAIVAGTKNTLSVNFAALLAFLMVNNLLLANQFPDIHADKSHGRVHLLIKYGLSTGVKTYGITTFTAAGTILIAVMTGEWNQWALLALLPWMLTIKTLMALNEQRENIGQEPQGLAMNVIATLLTPLVVALALLFGH